jgi:hypothetical protein
MKVVYFLSLFILILFVQLGAQNFSGQMTFSEKSSLEKHERLISQFRDKTSCLTEAPEPYTEHIYQEWENEDWSNLIKQTITVDATGEIWIWIIEESYYSGSVWMKSDSIVITTTPMIGGFYKMLKSDNYVWVETKWIHSFIFSYTYVGDNLTEILVEIAFRGKCIWTFPEV